MPGHRYMITNSSTVPTWIWSMLTRLVVVLSIRHKMKPCWCTWHLFHLQTSQAPSAKATGNQHGDLRHKGIICIMMTHWLEQCTVPDGFCRVCRTGAAPGVRKNEEPSLGKAMPAVRICFPQPQSNCRNKIIIACPSCPHTCHETLFFSDPHIIDFT